MFLHSKGQADGDVVEFAGFDNAYAFIGVGHGTGQEVADPGIIGKDLDG